jgi:hypothetical protein
MSSKDLDGGFWNAKVAREQFYDREVRSAITRRLADSGAKFALANFC